MAFSSHADGGFLGPMKQSLVSGVSLQPLEYTEGWIASSKAEVMERAMIVMVMIHIEYGRFDLTRVGIWAERKFQ